MPLVGLEAQHGLIGVRREAGKVETCFHDQLPRVGLAASGRHITRRVSRILLRVSPPPAPPDGFIGKNGRGLAGCREAKRETVPARILRSTPASLAPRSRDRCLGSIWLDHRTRGCRAPFLRPREACRIRIQDSELALSPDTTENHSKERSTRPAGPAGSDRSTPLRTEMAATESLRASPRLSWAGTSPPAGRVCWG